MTKITKDEMMFFTNPDINIYIGFSDLSEDEYEQEKKRINYSTHNLHKHPTEREQVSQHKKQKKLKKQATSIENEIDINEELDIQLLSSPKHNVKQERKKPSTSLHDDSATYNDNNNNNDTTNFFTLSTGIKIKCNSNLIKNITTYTTFPESLSKCKNTSTPISLYEDSFTVPNCIPHTTISKSPFDYQSIMNLLQSQNEYTSITDTSPSIINTNNITSTTTTTTTTSDIVFLSLNNHPLLFSSLHNIIPLQCRPKSQHDVLKHSPLDISGINIPRLIISPHNTTLTHCFHDCTHTQFKRIFINFGPCDIIHFTLRKEHINNYHLNLDALLTKSEEDLITFFNARNIEFTYHIQRKGDITLIDAGVIHIPLTAFSVVHNTNILAHWAFFPNQLRDIEIALKHQQTSPSLNMVPLYITLTKMINAEMITNAHIDISVIKTIHRELTPYLNEHNDIKKYYEFMIRNKISLYQQPATSNIAFCDYCQNEIYNYYNISALTASTTGSTDTIKVIHCLTCYIRHYEHLSGNTKDILLYKFTDDDINTLFERMNLLISNKKHNALSLINQNQQCFDIIKGDNFDYTALAVVDKVNEYVYENVYNNDYGDVDMISRFLIPNRECTDEKSSVLNIRTRNGEKEVSHYIEYENIIEDGKRFSPLNQPRRLGSNEYETVLMNSNLHTQRKSEGSYGVSTKKSNKSLFESLLRNNNNKKKGNDVNDSGIENVQQNGTHNNNNNNVKGCSLALYKGRSFMEMLIQQQKNKRMINGTAVNNVNNVNGGMKEFIIMNDTNECNRNGVRKVYDFDEI